MVVLHLEALAGIALALAVVMAVAWMVRQRTGSSGWIDTLRTFSGLAGAGSAPWPVGGAAPNGRQWLVAALLAPVFMYRILGHVTGIPPLEAQRLRSRGDHDRDYQSRTIMFFPRPPQKGVVT